MSNDNVTLKEIAGAAELMQPTAECPTCSRIQARLGDISEKLTRVESLLLHIANGQLLLPTPHAYTPISSGVSSVAIPSISSGNVSVSSTSPVKVITVSDVQRNDFDNICIPYYRHEHILTEVMLEAISQEAVRLFSNIHKRDLHSKIREWYRKRREYESQRVFTYCSRVFRQMSTEQVLEMLNNDEGKLLELMNACRVEYDDVNKAKQYALERAGKHMQTLELYQKMGAHSVEEEQLDSEQ